MTDLMPPTAGGTAPIDKPADKPRRPHFSSGPCAKPPGWSPEKLPQGSLGRSHRSKIGKARLQHAIELTRRVLRVPATHRIGIVPASDTGAVEMALWSLLGARPVTVMAWESFGQGWVTDIAQQLKLDPTVLTAPYGQLPDLGAVDWTNDVVFTWNGTTSGVRVPDADLVFTWNGTTSGVRVPNADFISAKREGVVICDATSAAFAQPLDWAKLDVVTFSWQKALGGEAAHGVLILSPRAVARLESYTPAWPMPKLFRMTKAGRVTLDIFEGATINTPSMLAVEDAIDALKWAASIGGLSEMRRRADANLGVLEAWVQRTGWAAFLAADPAIRSNTSVCLKVIDPRVTALSDDAQANFAKKLAGALEKEGVALDVGGYRDAPPGLRIWCGATVDTSDLDALTPWLDWAFTATLSEFQPA